LLASLLLVSTKLQPGNGDLPAAIDISCATDIFWEPYADVTQRAAMRYGV
jgi:hypothetical protein